MITTRPRGYRKFPRKSIALAKPFLRRYPAIYQALKTRYIWYNDTLAYIDRRVAEGAAILIAPEKPLEISRVCHDPATMQRVYDLGRKAADQAIAASNRGDWAWH